MEFEVNYHDFDNFMRKTKPLLLSEIVAAAEEMLYSNLESLTICRIKILKNEEKINMDFKVKLSDFISDIDILLNWVVEREEYELAHRIKLLKDYLIERETL